MHYTGRFDILLYYTQLFIHAFFLMTRHLSRERGFTLIELLIVIAIIAILAAAVFVALDPLTRFQEARDSQRWSDLNSILSAVKVDQIDNDGAYSAAITALTADTEYQIGTAGVGCNDGCTAVSTEAACVDLSSLVTDGYLGSVPLDPSTGTAAESDYYLIRNAEGTVTAGACDPEVETAITMTR